MKTMWTFSRGLIVTVFLLAIGCGPASDEQKTGGSVAPFDVNQYPINKLVCDPFGGGGAQSFDQGLKASLYYLQSGQAIPHSLDAMINQGARSANDLFFSQVNVPTRLFSAGFPLESGGLVKDDIGRELIEYFGLRFEGGLTLTPEDEEGTYEFALLSDDGARLLVNNGEGLQSLVDNDGDHPTRMGCGGTLTMTRESHYPIRLDYYQGPRHHISVIPMWRRIGETRMSEPQCGQLGNGMYFNYNNNSQPQTAYLNLLLKGWKPIAAGNYKIPKAAAYNPCVQGEIPLITNFVASINSEGIITASWTTDIPATTQLLYRDVDTGMEFLTTANNSLTTNHSVTVRAAISFGYDVQGVSISATMGRALSETLRLFDGPGL